MYLCTMKIKIIILTIVSLVTLILSSFSVFTETKKTKKVTVQKFAISPKEISMGNLVVVTIKKKSMNFMVCENEDKEHDFYMNSNFFDKLGSPIGEVVVDGKVINHNSNGGGYFYSNGGEPSISLYQRPKNVKYCSQTGLIGIINGKINKKITKTHLNKQRFYRTLIGKNSSGDLIIIHSDVLGLVSIEDICKFGIAQGIKDGLLFDGGSSVDIKVKSDEVSHYFKSVPDVAKVIAGIDQPPVYIVGDFN